MKYLIRGGRLPYEKVGIERYLNENMFGSNTGNYMYLNSVIRTLMTSDQIQFEATGYKWNYSAREIERINEECDAFLIPLADAFRPNFVGEMVGLTKLVNKLSIPCYIIGVGVSAGSEERLLNKNFGFEAEATAFVKAVLNKSSCIGVRGQFTGDFLKYLGFREDTDYRVIGCPSLYTYGNHIQIRDTIINPDCKAASNGTLTADMETIKKLNEYRNEFHNITFVGQLINELKTLYLGVDYKEDQDFKAYYPCDIHHPLYANDRVRVFYNTDRWIDFFRDIDFSFGTRFHGNVPATIAGTPALLIVKDIRMKELADFHHLTYVSTDELAQYNDIWEIIEQANFHSPESVAKENFSNYLDFLHDNDLKTIYDENIDRADSPLDELLAKTEVLPDVSSCVSCSSEELAERLRKQYIYVFDSRNGYKNEVRRIREDSKKQKQTISDLNRDNAQLTNSNKKLKELNNHLEASNKKLKESNEKLKSEIANEKNKPLHKKIAEDIRGKIRRITNKGVFKKIKMRIRKWLKK